MVINQVGITPERQKKFDFSEPYIASKAVLIVNDKSSIKSFEDLKGKKSAHTLTSNYAQIARKYGADIEKSGVLLRKNNPQLKAAIDKALEEIKADGTYERISQKYFGADVSK